MRFKDIFNKYINKEATDDEITYIEEEIEKSEIINDYLANKIEEDMLLNDINLNFENEDINENNGKEDGTLKELKKAINKKLLNVGMISALGVVCFLLSLKFIVSPIMNKIYYNPLDDIDGYSRRIDIDLEILSELHFPGISNMQVFSKSLGFGVYDIEITQQSYFDNDTRSYKAELDKNKFEVDKGFYKNPSINVFTRDMAPFYEYPSDGDSEQIKKLESLPDYINAKVMVSFKQDLEIKDVMEVMKDREIHNQWIGVRSFDMDVQRTPHIGFVPNGTGVVFEEKSFDTEKYPYFDLGWVDLKKIESTPEILETHFKSILRYMADNENFAKTDILFKNSDSFYREALGYVDKNGVKSYGVVVSGSPSEILKLRNHPIVENIYLEDLYL